MNLKAIEKNPVRHIFAYSVPSIIAMILTSLVVIVDGYFVSNQVGKEALAAINLGLPMLYVFLAVGIMIGVGGVSIAGRRLGEKKVGLSINGFNQTIATGLVASLILSVFFSIALKPMASMMGMSEGASAFMKSYYRIMIWTYPLMIANVIFGMFIRCEGKPQVFMMNTIITTIINVLLDYAFISVLEMGVSGAAYSSAIAVAAGSVVMVACFMSDKTLFSFRKCEFSRPDFDNTIANGSSEFIGQIAFSITMFFMNAVVSSRMGLAGIAALSIIGYSKFIYDMVVVGFGQGISPMVSFSYGAGRVDISDMLRKRTTSILFIFGLLFYAVLNVYGETYARVFTQDVNLISMVSYGLWIFTLSFVFGGFNQITSFYFTSVGYAKQSAVISSLRGLVLLSINIYVVPVIFGNTGIWMVSPVTEIMTFVVSFYLLKSARIEAKAIDGTGGNMEATV